MSDTFSRLAADAAFKKKVSAMRKAVPAGAPESMDAVFEHFRQFAASRRQEVRIALLTQAGRTDENKWQSYRDGVPDAMRSMHTVVRLLSKNAQALASLISPQLDEVLALAVKNTHPLYAMLHEGGVSLGFTRQETEWLLGELHHIGYKAVQHVCADGPDDLFALLSGISVGEAGLLIAGFVRFTGDPETDKRIENIVLRLREKKVTASIFIAFVIVWVAHTVARQAAQSAR